MANTTLIRHDVFELLKDLSDNEFLSIMKQFINKRLDDEYKIEKPYMFLTYMLNSSKSLDNAYEEKKKRTAEYYKNKKEKKEEIKKPEKIIDHEQERINREVENYEREQKEEREKERQEREKETKKEKEEREKALAEFLKRASK